MIGRLIVKKEKMREKREQNGQLDRDVEAVMRKGRESEEKIDKAGE